MATKVTASYIPNCIKNLETSIKPSHQDKRFYPSIKDFYNYLAEQLKDKDQLKANYKEWSKKFDVSPRTLRRWIHFFEDRNLIEIVSGGAGRGRKLIIKLTKWLKKKIQLAAKGIKTPSKERIKELEKRYLKKYAQPRPGQGKNLKMDTKQLSIPEEKTYLTEQRGIKPQKQQKTQPRWKTYQKNLSELDDNTTLVGQSEKKFDIFMAMTRLWLWEEKGVSRKENDQISNAVGSLIKGQPFSVAVEVWNRLRSNISEIIKISKSVITSAKNIYFQIKDILAGLGPDSPKPKRKGKLPPNVNPDEGDLTTHQGRVRFREKIERKFRDSDNDFIYCPRCGGMVTSGVLRNSSIAYEYAEDNLCTCLAVIERKEENVEEIKQAVQIQQEFLENKEYLDVPNPEEAKKAAIRMIKQWKLELFTLGET